MSEAGDLLTNKSMDFAVRIVNLYKWLCSEKKEYVMSKQLLRCGTSIGANISEAQSAISKADFASKVYISLKECKETQYWIRLLHRTDFLDESQYISIMTLKSWQASLHPSQRNSNLRAINIEGASLTLHSTFNIAMRAYAPFNI